MESAFTLIVNGRRHTGMILSTVARLGEKARPTDAEILAWMTPQICRCCGYPRIMKAVRREQLRRIAQLTRV